MNTGTEHLVHLVNEEEKQAKVAVLRVQGGQTADAISQAKRLGFQNFNVIEITDSPDGCSEQRSATVRNGERV